MKTPAMGMVIAWTALMSGACSSPAPAKTDGPATVSTTPSASEPAAAAPDTSAEEETRAEARIARVLSQVAQLRKLAAKAKVPGRVVERGALLAELKAQLLREVPREAIEREGLSLKLAGLLPLDADYETIMFRLLEEQLAGFYLPNEGRMFLAKDLDPAVAEATLVHELVHALQDQHYDLKAQTQYKPGEGDRSYARSGLAEGDASSLMLDFMAHAPPDGEPSASLERLMVVEMQSTMPDYAPQVLQRSLVSPYVNGLKFVNELRRRGGWAMVDAAWRNPPVTSEQILHVDKFLRHEPALAIAAPEATVLGPGFVREDDDSFGEEGLKLMLEGMLSSPFEAAPLAAGWGGDRNTFARDKSTGAIAVVAHVRYDADRRGNVAKLIAGLAKANKGKPQTAKGITSLCVERDRLGPQAFVARGADVVMVFGPAAPKAWTSAGTCAEAVAAARRTLGD